MLGLPGNPVSAMVCAVQFLIPAIERLSGLPGGPPRTLRALAGAALAENDRRFDHLRATLAPGPDGQPVATPFPLQDSSMLKVLSRAEALILRRRGPRRCPPARSWRSSPGRSRNLKRMPCGKPFDPATENLRRTA